MNDLTLIGRAEMLKFPEQEFNEVYARIDTGAKTSSIWASDVQRKGDKLYVVFWGENSPQYTGKKVEFSNFGETVVASSNGAVEHRYKIKLLVVIHGKRIRAYFTLANRATQAYPVLVGRNILRNRFVVDVSKGEVLLEAERKRSNILRSIRLQKKGKQ